MKTSKKEITIAIKDRPIETMQKIAAGEINLKILISTQYHCGREVRGHAQTPPALAKQRPAVNYEDLQIVENHGRGRDDPAQRRRDGEPASSTAAAPISRIDQLPLTALICHLDDGTERHFHPRALIHGTKHQKLFPRRGLMIESRVAFRGYSLKLSTVLSNIFLAAHSAPIIRDKLSVEL
ncbi:hypothetical protein EVAR_2285_1 [Eumeta japonica]|uniref:Uncharacterized protein n=1 Tax=Eumeta variegata TaxID=151549 RepID=A0A4C1SFR7_EUMVA|nr:hypothetical protein EVAR_2285_1 [Eumeta japonica]